MGHRTIVNYHIWISGLDGSPAVVVGSDPRPKGGTIRMGERLRLGLGLTVRYSAVGVGVNSAKATVLAWRCSNASRAKTSLLSSQNQLFPISGRRAITCIKGVESRLMVIYYYIWTSVFEVDHPRAKRDARGGGENLGRGEGNWDASSVYGSN
jgi:hypothetical protein